MTCSRARARGFTLIEALIAVAVMAFGMLALTVLQAGLARNADVSKQRTEAMRLAQERIEALRSFTDIEAGTINWNGLASGSDTISSYAIGADTVGTNTTYTRTWTLAGNSAWPMRPVSVSVAWTDRAGDAQSTVLSSVISKTDPADAGFLGFPLPQNTNLKRPKNRNINIPVQATDLGGGKSAFQLASNYAIIFSDTSGYVVEKCTTTVTAANYADGTANCTTYNAYILAGYVSGSVSSSSGTATMPTGVNTSGLTGWDNAGKTISCTYAQARDQNTATLIANYHYYICVVPVVTNGTYGGTLRLGGVGTAGNYKVCRFQYASSAYVNANQRNLQPYVSVSESLDNQNYYVADSNDDTCPTIVSTTEPVANASVATQMHQNCRSSGSPGTGANGTCPATAHNTGP